jgi:NitT/TauT family transport system substrate-binding protein
VLWPGEYPILIADELNLFEKHGVAVELVFYEAPLEELADMRSGKVDGAILVIGDVLAIGADKPDPYRVVLVTDTSEGADVVVATQEIATPADLKGKRIGADLGSFGELLVHRMLLDNGLTPGDVSLVEVGPELVPSQLPDKIQAGHTWDPYTAEALAAGHHIIFSSADTPGLIADVLVFETAVVTERPDDVRAFIAAWFEGVAYWQAHPAESATIVAKHTGLKPEEVSMEGVKLFNREDNLAAFTPGETTASLYYSAQLHADFFITGGGVNTTPDTERLLDPSFLK